MDFLELVDSYSPDTANAGTVLGGEGSRVRSLNTPEYQKGLLEATKLMGQVMSSGSKYYQWKFEEAMSTSDFPVYLGDMLDRAVLANYAEAPYTYNQWCKVSEVKDFRPTKRLHFEGGDGALKPVEELGEYREVTRTGGMIDLRVKKYGARFDFSWEALLEDDFNILTNQPELFGVAARRTEEREATKLLHADGFFSNDNGNYLATNPLSVEGLTTAITKFSTRIASDGEPISIPPSILMVPPALEVQANAILNATEIQIWDDDNGEMQYRTNNWLKSKLKLVVNYYLPVIDPTNGNKDWYIMSAPNQGRPAFELAFLRGYRSPSMFMKSPNAVSIGGATAGALVGDFDHDAIGYKVRHVVGGSPIEPKSALKSRIA